MEQVLTIRKWCLDRRKEEKEKRNFGASIFVDPTIRASLMPEA